MSIEAAGDTTDEVALWLDIIQQANEIHDALPASMREEIDLGTSQRELCLLAIPLSRMSAVTRARVEAVLLELLADPVNRLGVASGRSRLALVPGS